MKYRILYLLLFVGLLSGFGLSQEGQIISAEYGPPDVANEWQKFTIPLTAEAFGVDAATFTQVLANVERFQIRTEMHDGADVGALDQINIGDRYVSSFDSGNEEWNAAGDGTMEWIGKSAIVPAAIGILRLRPQAGWAIGAN